MKPVIDLKPGDVFCGANPQSLGLAINYVQRFWQVDSNAEYGHSGIILDHVGTTFEALWSIKRRNIYQAYLGQEVLIGRNTSMNYETFWKGYNMIKQYEGRKYPGHRLAFFLFPPAAKYIHALDWGVCSELTSKFLMHCELLDFWRGVFPDYVADMIERWKGWEVIYKGEL